MDEDTVHDAKEYGYAGEGGRLLVLPVSYQAFVEGLQEGVMPDADQAGHVAGLACFL